MSTPQKPCPKGNLRQSMVEVLAPEALRREIATEMKAAGALYKTIRKK